MRKRDSVFVQVISLVADAERRFRLKRYLAGPSGKLHFLDATDYRDYAPPGIARAAKESSMTLGEVGCTYSHIRALSKMLKSGAQYGLILEDDVGGASDAIHQIDRIASIAPPHMFLLCGGQQGLRSSRYLYGCQSSLPGIYKIHPLSRMFISRACAYMVSRTMAQHLLHRHKARLVRADDWEWLLRGIPEVYYADIFTHPNDLSGSHLEGARQLMAGGALRKLARDGIYLTARRNVQKVALRCLAGSGRLVRLPS
jgi:glycosyl transferase, family 25